MFWATEWNDGRERLLGEDFFEFDEEGRILRAVSFDGFSIEG